MTSRDHLHAAARCWEHAGFYEDAAERFTRAEAWHDSGRCFSQAQRHHDAALAYSRAEEPLLEARQYLMPSWPERARSLCERLRLGSSLSPREEVEVLLGLGEVEAAQRVALGSSGREAVATLARLAGTRGRPDLAAPFWSHTDASSWESFTPWNRSLRWQLPPPVVESAKIWPSVEFSEVSLVPIWEEKIATWWYGDPALDWSADGANFAVALFGAEIARGWIGPEGIQLDRWQLSNEVQCVKFLPASNAVLAGHSGGEVSLVGENGSVQTMESLRMPQNVLSLTFSPAGDRVAVSSMARAGALLKVSTWQAGQARAKLEEHLEPKELCRPLSAWSPDGRQLCWSPGPLGPNRLFFSGQLPLEAHVKRINSLAFTPDSRFLITASWDRKVVIRDAVKGQRLAPPHGFLGKVYGASVHPHGALVAVGERDRLHLLRLQDGESPRLWSLSEQILGTDIQSLAFSPDGCLLLVMTGEFLPAKSGQLLLFRVDLKP